MRRDRYLQLAAATILSAGMLRGIPALADEAPVQSKHQMMKDCMAKQKASESGRPREEMKKSCKDVTKTEKQNAHDAATPPGDPPSH
jgi:hypothetical protein